MFKGGTFMVFSNFAQVLYSVLAEGRSFAQFTRNLFLNITDYSDSEENPIEDAEDGTLKAVPAARMSDGIMMVPRNANV